MAETPWLSREPSGGLPYLGGNSLDGQSEQSSWHSNQIWVSQESSQSGCTKSNFSIKVNVPTFKDKRPKMQCSTTHGIGMCPCFATQVGMITICCPMSLGLC